MPTAPDDGTGWDGWIRTNDSGSQSPLPYRLATPQYGVAQPEQPLIGGTDGLNDASPMSGCATVFTFAYWDWVA